MSAGSIIGHNKPWLLQEDIAAVSASLSTGWIAPGHEVAALENEFSALHGGGNSCTVSSGTAALFIALKACGVKAGETVACPTYVCSAILNAISLCGAKPALVDIDKSNFNIDVKAAEELPERPRVAIAVHTYGSPADIIVLRGKFEVVIEDCCQSLGGSDADGRALGTLGHASIFSFYATKLITCGHGGMVYARDTRIAAEARDYIMFDGRTSWSPRFNFQLTDFQAALVRQQLSRIDEIAARRRKLVTAYRAALPSVYSVQQGITDNRLTPYRFVISAPDQSARDRLHEHLAGYRIESIIPLQPHELLHRLLGLEPAAFPHAEHVAATTLSVPIYPALSESEIGRITDALGTAPSP